MNKSRPDRIAYRPQEAAHAAGVSVPTLYSWLRREDFPVVRIQGCTVIPIEEYRSWLTKQRDKSQ